jgi:hypothetical protein
MPETFILILGRQVVKRIGRRIREIQAARMGRMTSC